MTNQELLDELRLNMLRDGSDLVSGPTDQLWSDDTLLRYMNDAYRRFARRSLLLRDNETAQYTQITLVAGQVEYLLDPVVLAVISARYDADENDLPRSSHDEIATNPYVDTLMWDINSLSATPPGRPRVWYTDEAILNAATAQMKLRVFPAPSADEANKIIYLRVARLPAAAIDATTLGDTPEIPEDYHLDMLDWAAYRALRNHDVDGESKDRAENFKTRFEETLAEVEEETLRKLFATTRFAFGRSGFSWSRNAN